VRVNVHPVRINRDNVLDLSRSTTSSWTAPTLPHPYLLNDASLMSAPVMHASILRFEGHASVFLPYVGPCYRCLFPEPPPPELRPRARGRRSRRAAGPDGQLQATEAIKVLVGAGDSLAVAC